MTRLVCLLGLLLVPGAAQTGAEDESLRWFAPADRTGQLEYEVALLATPDAASARSMHETLSSEPHVAGTPGDARVIASLVQAYQELGLEVERHEIEVLLAAPVSATVEVIERRPRRGDAAANAEADVAAEPSVERLTLPLREAALEADPFSGHADLLDGWNAYSGSGDVTAEVVFANFGTRADFETLEGLGISVEGKIVIARYGGNFRGFKAKFAEAAGAAGLIIYTDPEDSGYQKGPVYPEGGWANETYIQRGSLKTLPYPGDPLTPFGEASPDAPRLEAATLPLPAIPVQPIGWGAAGEILGRMKGRTLPRELRGTWQGGLPFSYHLTGGPDLTVRLQVEQKRELKRTANVLATLRGTVHPEQLIVIGCHHDAWSFGAGDPNAGSIVVHEIARSFAEAARQGHRPARSIVFAHWAAEEFGIIGSTEWVEARRDELLAHGIAYLNLDMAAMGPVFGSSAAPLLRTLVADAARAVPQIGDATGGSVFEAWTGGADRSPSFGSLGGGSDHVGFYCHVGMPCASFGARGSDGVSYHSNYETLAWYRKVVGDDYEPAIMLARIGSIVAARLANAPVVPLDPRQYAADLRSHLETVDREARLRDMSLDLTELDRAVGRLERAAARCVQWVQVGLERDGLTDEQVQRFDEMFRSIERVWLNDTGLPDRPWYQSLYAATDPDSGYGAWMLPGLRAAVERGDEVTLAAVVEQYVEVVHRLAEHITHRTPVGD